MGQLKCCHSGTTDRRLVGEGDFNVETGYHELFRGLNTIVISIVDRFGNVYEPVGRRERRPEPSVAAAVPDRLVQSKVEDIAYVVDGQWAIDGDTVKNLDIGYDRLLAVGDIDWTDYEVTVPITLHGIDPGGFEYPSSGPAVGIILRWPGHYDVDGTQPRWGFAPLGALGWYRFSENGSNRLVISDGQGLNSVADPNFDLEFDTTYMFKFAVQTETGVGHRYTLKVWKEGEPEQTATTLTDLHPLTDLTSGSVFIILAHHVEGERRRQDRSISRRSTRW
ncbi:MAG: hypothetical protein R2715_20050 [Ilumatobacteraceae bacterium]